MEHAHVIAAGDTIEVQDLPPRLQPSEADADEPRGEDMSLQDIERCTIAKALKRVNYNKAAASRLLGINIQRLSRRISKLGIQVPK
jgi:DNA-binding NtrC family response regulator